MSRRRKWDYCQLPSRCGTMPQGADEMTELLPCPFCGGDKPYVYGPTCNKNTPYNPADRAAPWVVCGQCHAVIHGMDWDESKESAIDNWNRRAHLYQPHPVAQGEAVAWQRRDRITHGGGDAPGWSHWREVGRYEFDEHNGKYPHIEFRELFATPTIPTGHRVVPDGWKLVPIDRAYIPEIEDPEQMECNKDTLTRAQIEAISQYRAKLNTKPNFNKSEK